jgi:hypothetical protein
VPVSAPAVSGVVPCFPPRVDGSHAHASAPTDALPLFTISTCLGEKISITLGQKSSIPSVRRGFCSGSDRSDCLPEAPLSIRSIASCDPQFSTI